MKYTCNWFEVSVIALLQLARGFNCLLPEFSFLLFFREFPLFVLVCASVRRSQWPRGVRRTSAVAGVADSNPSRGIDVCGVYMLCCPVSVEASATG
jgi:hypothetical protein